jgi:hypothetical protein
MTKTMTRMREISRTKILTGAFTATQRRWKEKEEEEGGEEEEVATMGTGLGGCGWGL